MTKKVREYMRRRYREEFKPVYDEFMKLYPLTTDNLDGEEWRTMPDYEDYQVSNYGRIKSFRRGTAKIRKPALSVQGYLVIRFFHNKEWKEYRISRLVAKSFISNPDNKPEVNHIYSRFNNHISGLEWVTGSENQRHAVAMGLRKSGEDNYQAKLTNEQARYIRTNPDGLTGRALAKKFGVPPQRISKIRLGKIYKNE